MAFENGPKHRTMRCAVYARYSSDAQDARSLTDQVPECKLYAQNTGWAVVPEHVYQDAAVSGANITPAD